MSRGNEQGLPGLAFHPRFGENGRVYIIYTDPRADTRVVEYRLDPAHPGRVDMGSAREIFRCCDCHPIRFTPALHARHDRADRVTRAAR